MIVVLDVESTGLFDKTLPREHASQPRVIELAWKMFDVRRRLLAQAHMLLRPEGAVIDGTAIHGITEMDLIEHGLPPLAALHGLKSAMERSRYVLSYNWRFDRDMLHRECAAIGQRGEWIERPRLVQLCLMQIATDALGMDKWVALPLAHKALTGRAYEPTHRAADDVDAACRILWALADRGVLQF